MQEHITFCKAVRLQRVAFPVQPKDKVMKFINVAKQMRAPFVAYADFECLLVQDEDMKTVDTKTGIVQNDKGDQIEKDDDDNDEQKGDGKRETFRKHVAVSYAYKIIGPNEQYNKNLVLYPPNNIEIKPETDVAEHFLDAICKEADNIWEKHIKHVTPMVPLTAEEEEYFRTNNVCHICEEEIVDPSDKVKDHDHVTGLFRSIAHNKCNREYRIIKDSWKLTVMFHKMRRYDAHLIIKAVQQRHGELEEL